VTGLRERKKLQTRQHIAEVAMRLFAEHGFEEVTVDQIAAAADVAKKTVFNYFPTKEDLVFSRADQHEQDLIALVREHSAGTPLVEAFRAWSMRRLDRIAELPAGFQRGSVFDLTRHSQALQRRGLEMQERWARLLAEELAAANGRPAWDPVSSCVARTLLNANRSAFMEVHRQLQLGATSADAARAGRAAADQIYDLLEHGLAGYP
jgi:AcrR family transcriptional regulator